MAKKKSTNRKLRLVSSRAGVPGGALSRALDEAPARGRAVVDRKKDWTIAYPFDR